MLVTFSLKPLVPNVKAFYGSAASRVARASVMAPLRSYFSPHCFVNPKTASEQF